MRVYTQKKKIGIIVFCIIMAMPWFLLILYIMSSIQGIPLAQTHFGTKAIVLCCILACIVSVPISSLLMKHISFFQPNDIDIVMEPDKIRIGNDVVYVKEIKSCYMTSDGSSFSEYDKDKSKSSVLGIKCENKNYNFTCEYTPKFPIYLKMSSMDDVYSLNQFNMQLAKWCREHNFTPSSVRSDVSEYFKEKEELNRTIRNRKKTGICILAIPILIFAFFIFMMIRSFLIAFS